MRGSVIFVIAVCVFVYEVSTETECPESEHSCSDKVNFCLYDELDVIEECGWTEICTEWRNIFYSQGDPSTETYREVVSACLRTPKFVPRLGRSVSAVQKPDNNP